MSEHEEAVGRGEAVELDPTEPPTERRPEGEHQPSARAALATQSAKARYEKGVALGRGGMGEVREVLDRGFNRHVAMKTLWKTGASAEELDLFVAEAQINSQLEHPNLVPIHDIGVGDDGKPYFTMRLVRGHMSLKALIEGLREGDEYLHATYTFERRVQLIQQVCHALNYAHQRGVVHCDIKPANIVVGDCGELFVVDWGISQLTARVDEAHPHGQVSVSEHIKDANPDEYGTARYMAPERLAYESEATPQTDLYALVAVLYELLSLHHYLGAYRTNSAVALYEQLYNGEVVSAESYMDAHNGRVPRTLSNICKRGLAFEPEHRFQSVTDFQVALQAWVEGRIPMVCPGTIMQRCLAELSRAVDRHPVLIPMASVVLLSLGGIVVVLALLELVS